MMDLFSFPTKFFQLETELSKSGYTFIAGIDEVGRGALAGPVVAAAVILDPQTCSITKKIKDSKKLSPEVREELSEIIHNEAIAVGIGMIHHDMIDQINILQATFKAMLMALEKLGQVPDMCLVDGNQKIPSTIKQMCIIKGDDRVTSIGAASIVAKVFRDRWMKDAASQYPQYRFEKNKGYGSKEHVEAIQTNGYTQIHRRSFSIKSLIEK